MWPRIRPASVSFSAGAIFVSNASPVRSCTIDAPSPTARTAVSALAVTTLMRAPRFGASLRKHGYQTRQFLVCGRNGAR